MTLRQRLAQEINSPASLTLIGWHALWLSVVTILIRTFAVPDLPYILGGDFKTFWAASWLAQHGELARLYGTKMLENIPTLAPSIPPWFYPPPMLLVVYPLSSLPFVISHLLFASFCVLVAVGVWKYWRLEKQHLLLLLAAPATTINFFYGQNGLLITALWIVGLLLLQKRQAFLAGCILGLLVVKPHLALLAPLILLAGREWRALAGLVFSSCLLLNLSWFAFGTNIWLDFLGNASGVMGLLRDQQIFNITKLCSMYVASRMAGAGHIEALVNQGLLALVAITITLYLWTRRDVAYGNKAAAALVAALLITPYQFIYDLSLLLGAIVFWHQASGKDWRGADRCCVWLLWIAPFLTQGVATVFGIGCLPAILLYSLIRVASSAKAPASTLPQ